MIVDDGAIDKLKQDLKKLSEEDEKPVIKGKKKSYITHCTSKQLHFDETKRYVAPLKQVYIHAQFVTICIYQNLINDRGMHIIPTHVFHKLQQFSNAIQLVLLRDVS